MEYNDCINPVELSSYKRGEHTDKIPPHFKEGIINLLRESLQKRTLSSKIIANSFIDVFSLVVKTLYDKIHNSGKIMIAGNGGSASLSQHFCAELMGRMKIKRAPIPALSLCADSALITCIANDFGYERIFSRQIEGIGNVNDVFVAITTSGKSRNILEALLECKSRNITSIVFTGKETESLIPLADYVVSIPIEDTSIVQEIQLQLIHIICEIIDNSIQKDDNVWSSILKLAHEGFNTLILDRDGVINNVKANGYINSVQEFSLRKDFLFNVQKLSELFDHIFVVTNQKGVGKGLLSINDVETVHKKMVEDIVQHGGRIDKIYVSTGAKNDDFYNKPNIGMAELIKQDFPEVDLGRTIVVGDSVTDYLFAKNLKSKFVYARTR